MSSKHLLIIKGFSNKELVSAINKNGFSEISETLSKKNVSGEDFLELTELSIRKWKVPSEQTKKITECLFKLKNFPENFCTLSTSSPLFKRGYSVKKTSLNSENNDTKKKLELIFKPDKTPSFSIHKPQYKSNTSSDTPNLPTASKKYDTNIENDNNNNNNNSDIEDQLEYGNIENNPAVTIENKIHFLPPKPKTFEKIKDNNQSGKVKPPSPTIEKRPWMANKNNLAAQVGTNQSQSSDERAWMRTNNKSEQTIRKPQIKPNIEASFPSKPNNKHSKMQSGPPIPARNPGMKKESFFQQVDKSSFLPELSLPLKSKTKLNINTSVEIRKLPKENVKKDRATAPSSPIKMRITVKNDKHSITRISAEIRPGRLESFRKSHQLSSPPAKSITPKPNQASFLPVRETISPDYLDMDKCSNDYLTPRSVTPQPAAVSTRLAHQVPIRPTHRPPAVIPREEVRQRLSVDNVYSIDPTTKKCEEDYIEILANVPECIISRPVPVAEYSNRVQVQPIPRTSPNLTKRPLPPTPDECPNVVPPIVLNEEEKRVTDIIYYEDEHGMESSRNLTLNHRKAVILTNLPVASGAHGIPPEINNLDEIGKVLKSESPEPEVPALLPKKVATPSNVEDIYENSNDAKSNLPSVAANSSYETYTPPDVFPDIDILNAISDIEDGSDCDDSDDDCGDISLSSLMNDPYYQYTDRKGAKLALRDHEDGSFLFRTSKKSFLGLTIKYKKKFFNLSLTKTPSNKLKILSDEESPEFSSIKEFVQYFTREPLTFIYDNKRIAGIYLKEPSH